MKKIFFLLTGILGIAFSVQAGSKITRIKVKASIYCDHCQKCESCGKRLETAVYGVKGVKRMDIDPGSKTVEVIYNADKATPDQIREAIAAAGFDADGLKGNAKVYEQWDDCCKRD